MNRCSSLRADEVAVGENQLSEVRSITEIYRCAEMTLGEGDASSQSTLEGTFKLVSADKILNNDLKSNLIPKDKILYKKFLPNF